MSSNFRYLACWQSGEAVRANYQSKLSEQVRTSFMIYFTIINAIPMKKIKSGEAVRANYQSKLSEQVRTSFMIYFTIINAIPMKKIMKNVY